MKKFSNFKNFTLLRKLHLKLLVVLIPIHIKLEVCIYFLFVILINKLQLFFSHYFNRRNNYWSSKSIGFSYFCSCKRIFFLIKLHCLIFIIFQSLSKQHAKITVNNGKYFITDLGSSNKTFHNKVKIKLQRKN